MGENCSNCVYIKSLEDKIASIWKQIQESKEQRNDHEKRIAKLETNTSVLEEKLDRMEKNIEKIMQILETLTAAPGQKWDKMTSAAVVAIVSGIIGVALGKLF